MRVLLVSNPTARSGRNALRIEQARSELAKRGLEADFLATLPDGRTIEAVRKALGMLPTGTANDQGKSFGLDAGDRALTQNLDVLVAGATTRLDADLLDGPLSAESIIERQFANSGVTCDRHTEEDRRADDEDPHFTPRWV